MEIKCARCKKLKSATKFNWKKQYTKRSSYCKTCSRWYIRRHYKENTNYYLLKAKKRNLRIRKESHDFLAEYLKKRECVDCGEKDILVLEFDHKDRTSKEMDVSRIIKATGSIRKLKREVSRCLIRCANCHRRKTAFESESWRLDRAPVA